MYSWRIVRFIRSQQNMKYMPHKNSMSDLENKISFLCQLAASDGSNNIAIEYHDGVVRNAGLGSECENLIDNNTIFNEMLLHIIKLPVLPHKAMKKVQMP